MKPMRLLLSILALLVFIGCTTQASKAVPAHVYAFGDSYSDNGNMEKIDPSFFSDGSYWEGRRSNGPTAVEVLTVQMNIDLSDYAVCGAKSDTSNLLGDSYGNTGLLGQIEKFITELNGKSADQDALYFIMIGANDYFEKIVFGASTDNSTIADRVVDNIDTGVSELAQAGAKRFLVAGPIDLTILPMVKNSYGQPADAAEFQSLLDSKLSSRIKDLEKQLKVEITYFDYVALSTKIRENPSAYNLSLNFAL